jgi:hypothetical protein
MTTELLLKPLLKTAGATLLGMAAVVIKRGIKEAWHNHQSKFNFCGGTIVVCTT